MFVLLKEGFFMEALQYDHYAGLFGDLLAQKNIGMSDVLENSSD